jgi:hypothetical protein
MLTFDNSINLFYTIKFREYLQPCAHTHITMNYQLPRHQLLAHSAVGTSTLCVKPSSIKSSSPPFIQGPLRLYESIFIGASLLTQKVIDYSKWKKAYYFIY